MEPKVNYINIRQITITAQTQKYVHAAGFNEYSQDEVER